jgi:hypothetical protein
MKRLLFTGLIGLALAACSNEDAPEQNGDDSSENRYMAVSLITSQNSRADSDFADGEDDEYLNIDSDGAVFFFFNADGTGYTIGDSGKSYVTSSEMKTLTAATAEEKAADATLTDNVSSKSDIIIVLSSIKNGNVPSNVVALLNSNLTLSKDVYSLAEVKSLELTAGKYTKDSKTYFPMSNAAYYDGTANVYATPISIENLALTADAAKDNPVRINVERVVSKIDVSITGESTSGNPEVVATVKYADNSELGKVYARIDGWGVYNTTPGTSLIKNIDGLDTSKTWWIDTANKRTYWAVTPSAYASTLTNTQIKWSAVNGQRGYLYPFENTLGESDKTTTATDINTGVYFAVTLVDGAGSDAKPVDIALWLSKYYKLNDLKTAIASYLSNTLYSYDADAKTWTSISSAAISGFTADTNGYRLTPTVSGTWYKKGSTTALTTTELDAILDAVPKAQVWNGGKCYYYTTINHNLSGSDVPGLVRNHWYQLAVNKITGLGTPVYDPDQFVDPTKPRDDEYQEWYLSAEVRVLSWRMVKQNIELDSTGTN